MSESEKDDSTVARTSSAFERPAGNVYVVPDDGGSPLEDVSERPALVAPVDLDEATDR